MKNLATAAVMILGLAMFAGNAKADHQPTVYGFAYTLRQQAIDVAHEVRYGFRQSPRYQHLYEDAYQMYFEADHVLRVANQPTSRAHLLRDIAELDELFHQFEDVVAEMDGPTPLSHVSYGHHGTIEYRFGRSVSRYHVRRLDESLASMGRTLHALQDLLDYHPCAPAVNPLPPVPTTVPTFVPTARRSVPVRRSGIQVFRSGNGRIGFSLNIR